MESTVSNSSANLFSFFEMTPDLLCVVNKEGFLIKINDAVVEKLGYTREELIAKPVSAFIFPEDLELTLRKRDSLLNGHELINFENRYVTKDGNIIWLNWTSFYMPDLEIVCAIAKDITDRKNKQIEIEEKYKKFKALSDHFKRKIEKDRKTFSIELHEELAQLASVILMELHIIKKNIPDVSEFLASRIEHASAISKLLIQTTRKIAFEMSPYMLDQFGLDETLKWLCNDLSLLNHIRCDFESDYDERGLSQEIKLDFFRICQESLSNVMNHAFARSVKISIKDEQNILRLSITDDGRGFDAEKQLQTSGLTNIRERVASINGKLIIQSVLQEGTSISVTIPRPVSDVNKPADSF
ncbi:MAG: PAS domain S-box protein [Ginsengibacter sp.]